MTYVGIIPARFGSSRFPGKVLCDLNGKPMIQRTYESVTKWNDWQAVYVATEDQMVQDACTAKDIPCLMTGDHHLDCLDRVAEAVEILERAGEGGDKYLVIQGDEPFFNVKTLNTDLSPSVINFYTHVHDEAELYSEAASNAVKVAVSKSERALYFSRYTLPYHAEKTKRSDEKPKFFKQLGIYGFTGEMIKKYTNTPPSHLECMEGIGLMRLLENDIDIHMRYTPHDSVSIDTEEDRQRVLANYKD